MIRNYLKIAVRTLLRTKIHSLINILGLGLGIASCILMVLFVRDEWTFDSFHDKADRIYRVYVKEDWGENQKFFNTVTPFPMGPVLHEKFSEIEKEVRFLKFNPQVKIGAKQFTEFVSIGGQDLFDVFDFPLSRGSRDALRQLNGVVLTREIAQKYFGNEDPLQRIISIQVGENFEEFVVRGVIDRIPSNSSIRFGILISDLNLPKMYNQQVLTSGWYNVNPETYVLVKQGVAVDKLQSRFPAVFKTLIGEDFSKSKYFVGLQPLKDIHLNTDFPAAFAPVNNPKYAFILAGIAGLILFVACINFITLSVGRSLQRAREVGIRKVAGAIRMQLIFQFVGEAVMVTLLGLIVGVLISFLCLPLFNDLAEKTLELKFDSFTAGLVASLTILIGVIAGSYPAFVLSGFKPSSVLKGKVHAGASQQGIRKVLVGFQLMLTIFLISSTLLMRSQLDFLRNFDLGYNREQLAVLPIHVPRVGKLTDRIKNGFLKIDQFKTELSHFPDITGVCGASHDFGNGGWAEIGYTDDHGTYRNFNVNIADETYIPTLGMSLKSGRNFSEDSPADRRRSIIVNESFVREYGWTDAVGKRIPGKAFADHEIIGVVRDFNFSSLYSKVRPLVIAMDPTIPLSGSENVNVDNSPIPKLMVRIRAGNLEQGIAEVKKAWEKISLGEEFAFSFVDQTLAAQYQNDQNLGKIVSIATLLAILIGSSGLYGLASLALQQRTREISIRKVMGATGRSLLALLAREYILLILICMALSVPLTIYSINQWLLTFEYRVDIGLHPFLLAGWLSLSIALLTVGYHVVRTAWVQPAETLKYE